MGQAEDCIHRACWTQLPSHQTQAAPAGGESLAVSVCILEHVWMCLCMCVCVSTPRTQVS